MSYLVDVILPENEIHLLGGPSGAGKTRWLLHTLLKWEKGEQFLGYTSHPAPWVYVAADRSVTSVERTLSGMGIDPGRITAIPAWDKGMKINELMDAIEKCRAHLVVWESFGSFVDEPAQGHQVKAFLSRMNRFCRQIDTTIIGIMESPKMKPYERYANPRQRISGAAAWGHFSETIMLVEPDMDLMDDDPANPYRYLYVCSRNGPAMKLKLCFDLQGCLQVVNDPSAQEVVEELMSRKRKPKKRS